MKRPIFPISIQIFLLILFILLIVVISVIVYLIYNPDINSRLQRYTNKKIDTIEHGIYLRIMQDPDKDSDGLTDVAEREIYKTDPLKSDSNGKGIPDGKYIYNVYKEAFRTGDDNLINQYRQNLTAYITSFSLSTSSIQFLGNWSLNTEFTYRSLQTTNLYVGMSDNTTQIVKQALNLRLKENNYKKSLELLQNELQKSPNSAILKYHLGLTYHGMGQYDKALSIYKDIENNQEVRSPLLYSDMAAASHALGNDNEFIRYMEFSIKEFPEYLDQYHNLAQYYQDKNQLKAEEILNKGLEVEPRYASLYNVLAIIHGRKNDRQTEFELYKKAISHDFLYAPAHLNLSILYDQTYGNIEEALIEARIASELDPNARHISRLANLYNKSGNTFLAQKAINKLLTMPDLDGKSYNDVGLMYMDQKNYAKAEVYFRKAIIAEPELSNSYNNLGIILYYTGRDDEAIINYKKAIEINSNYANAYNNLGLIYTKTQNYQEAQIALEKAIQLDPDTYRQYQNLGHLYRLLNNKEKTIFYYQKAVDLGTNNPTVLEYLKENK